MAILIYDDEILLFFMRTSFKQEILFYLKHFLKYSIVINLIHYKNRVKRDSAITILANKIILLTDVCKTVFVFKIIKFVCKCKIQYANFIRKLSFVQSLNVNKFCEYSKMYVLVMNEILVVRFCFRLDKYNL